MIIPPVDEIVYPEEYVVFCDFERVEFPIVKTGDVVLGSRTKASTFDRVP